jgi:hypothetical protein
MDDQKSKFSRTMLQSFDNTTSNNFFNKSSNPLIFQSGSPKNQLSSGIPHLLQQLHPILSKTFMLSHPSQEVIVNVLHSDQNKMAVLNSNFSL